jgi:hypothetical protein
MSAYKQFLSSDIIVTPFEVNKSFTFQGNQLTGSNVTIERYLGKNIQSDPFISGSNPSTGLVYIQDQELVYNSIKQLYYGNYLNSTASLGSPLNTSSLVPGYDELGNRIIGTIPSSGRYWTYPQTTLTFEHYFPTSSNSLIGVISIPVGLFGTYVQPNSFFWETNGISVYDDGEGNLIFGNTGKICGNIFYGHGIAIITSDSQPLGDVYGTATYGSSLYGTTDSEIVETFVTSSNVTCSFSSSFVLFENQYKCTVRENEYNFTNNPTSLTGSASNTGSIYYPQNADVKGFVTASYFAPYVTTVGLYDDAQNLLAIGKLAQPLPTSATTDITILVNIDR